MKKTLIAGYFIGMSLLTFVVAKAMATYKSGTIEVIYRQHDRELSDTESSTRHIIPVKGKDIVEKWDTKETRTKSLFGWETKIDTTTYPTTFYVDCNCGK